MSLSAVNLTYSTAAGVQGNATAPLADGLETDLPRALRVFVCLSVCLSVLLWSFCALG